MRSKRPTTESAKPTNAVMGCTMTGVHLDADATKVAGDIAKAVSDIADSNKALANALHALASRFASAQIESFIKFGG